MQRVLRTEAGRGANGTNPKLPPLQKKPGGGVQFAHT